MAPLHNLLQAAATNTPRYLFRTWCPTSGGDALCNDNAQGITPSFFLPSTPIRTADWPSISPNSHRPSLSSIADFSEAELKRAYQDHLLTRKQRPTLFSSWTPSFATALGYAQVMLQDGAAASSVHMSCLDIAALRSGPGGDRKIAIFTGDPDLYSATQVGGSHEYVVFGPIPGSAYATVVLLNLEQEGLLCRPDDDPFMDGEGTAWSVAWSASSKPEAIVSQLKLAARIGAAFGADYALAVACHVSVTCHRDIRKKEDVSWVEVAGKVLLELAKPPADCEQMGYRWYGDLDVRRICDVELPLPAHVPRMEQPRDIRIALNLLIWMEKQVVDGEAW